MRTAKKMTPDQMLVRDLKVPATRRAYELALASIRDFDSVVRRIEAEREECGMSKQDVARAAGLSPSLVRRLLTAPDLNPSWKTIQAVAYVVGLRVTLQPIRARGRRRSAGNPAHAL